jgi:HCOMODA/2-hydroxy-3-carboxy-muconic semialdehyde decarboxylase
MVAVFIAIVLSIVNPGTARADTVPAKPDAAAAKQKVIQDLVLAYHILYREGLIDAFGHVTARDPVDPTHYLMARSVQPPFVTAADIVELDVDSKPVKADAPKTPIERYIHGEIYRARPDVMAVVHSHAAAVLPFTVVGSVPLRAICHTCGFLGTGAPIFEIRTVAGDSSNMLVQNNKIGAALAKALGKSAVVLMRGHGFAATGASVEEAVYNAINTLVDARVEMDALRLGTPNYLTKGEADAVSRTHNASIDSIWEIWVKRGGSAAVTRGGPLGKSWRLK